MKNILYYTVFQLTVPNCGDIHWRWYRALAVRLWNLLPNGMLERIYEPKRKETTGWRKQIMTFMMYAFHKITLRIPN